MEQASPLPPGSIQDDSLQRAGSIVQAKPPARQAFWRSWFASSLICALVIMAGVFAWLYVKTGSASGALAYVNGERLILPSSQVSFGEGHPGEIRERLFHISNLASQDVRFLGSRASCSCIAAEEFPFVMHAGESRDLLLKVQFGPTPGELSHTITFYTDSEDKQIFTIAIVGKVVE